MKNSLSIAARNSFYSTSGKLGVKAISFGFTVLVIRWLGDAEYGQYVVVWSFVTVFAMLSDAGLSMYTIREVAKKKPGSEYIAGNIIVMRIILAALTMLLIVGTAWLLGYPRQFLGYVLLASTILLLYAVQDPLDAMLQAHERFDLAATAVIVGQLFFVGIGLVLLLAGWHIYGLIIAALLGVLISALAAWHAVRGYRASLQWHLKPRLWLGFLRGSIPFGLIKLWLSWSLRIGIIILSWFWLDRMSGWYGAAFAIILGILVVSNAISSSLYPTLSRQYAQDPGSMPQFYELALKYLIVITLPVAGGIFLSAGKWIDFLYGTEFAPAAVALAILIWTIPFAFITEFLRYVLLVTDRERSAVEALGLTVLFAILLSLWWIPIYGFLAAAIIFVVSEATLMLLYVWCLRFDMKSLNLVDVLIKPLLATVIMMAVVQFLSTIGLFWQIIFGSVTYVLMIWVLRVIKPDEYSLIIDLPKQVKRTLPAATKTDGQVLPLVSVFIPAYNADQFVAQAIESVLEQTYQHFEVIIVDDGSTDKTARILAEYQTHPKVAVYTNGQNRGMVPTWNSGLNLCQGELIAKLDADDFYQPKFLKTMVEFFQKHREMGLAFSGLNLIYPDGRREPEMKFLHSWVRDRDTILPILLRLCVIRSPTVCARRTCYEQLGNFVESMRVHADWEMWTRIAANYPVGFVAQRLANYRMNYGQNVTARAAINGHSMHDLQIWLDLLEREELPYHLNPKEQDRFRWGIYELEMHFAAMAAYHQHKEMQEAYADFAEQVMPAGLTSPETQRMRRVYIYLHQGVYAFRECDLKQARHYFLKAIKTGPSHCKAPWIWSKLLLTFLGKTKWGILYK